MFFLVGYRERLVDVDGTRVGLCPRFKGDAMQVHGARRGALTLFWIPLVPYRKRQAWICEACGKNAGDNGLGSGHRPVPSAPPVRGYIPTRPWTVDRSHWPPEPSFEPDAPFSRAHVDRLAMVFEQGGLGRPVREWPDAPDDVVFASYDTVMSLGRELESLGPVPMKYGRITDRRALLDAKLHDLWRYLAYERKLRLGQQELPFPDQSP